MTEEKIKVGSIDINVKYSLKDKPLVLFIHFSGGNMNMWDGIIPLFESDYSIIIPDIRGHGKSDKPLEGYHIDQMAKDLYLLMCHFGIEHCHIVGSSMGAEIGLSLAASHPELVRSLICEGALYNEFGEYGLFQGTEDEIELKKEALRMELATRVERIFQTKAEYIEEERTELTEQGLWNDAFLPFLENSLQQTEHGGYTYCYLNRVRTEYIEKYWDVRFEQYYKQVECPVLFLLSEEEWKNETIRSILSGFTEFLEVFEIAYIEHAVHAYVWMQLPEAAGDTVRCFLSKHS